MQLLQGGKGQPLKIYVAGPMRKYIEFNFPAFLFKAEELRSYGHEVRCPAEHDIERGFDYTDPEAWDKATPEWKEEAFAWDIESVLWADVVVVLPGWRRSEGALLETTIARYTGKLIIDSETKHPVVDEDEMEEAHRLINGPRLNDYGHPFDDFTVTAELWKPIIERLGFTPEAVALCMMQVKICRLLHTPDHRDSQVDLHGYAGTYTKVRQRRKEICPPC